MKLNTVLSLSVLFSFAISADEVCSKKLVEVKVNEMCAQISRIGEAVKTLWKEELFYTNCGKNYIWVQDTSPEIKMVIHPIKKRLDGQAIGKQKDHNKFLLFRKFDTEARANPSGAWVDYVWSKPGVEAATAKSSFVKRCILPTGTSWIVGSGVWREDLK